MKNIQVNKVNFRGQFADALERFEKNYVIDITDFKNGKWEATSKICRFMFLLDQAGIKFYKKGDSLRTTEIYKTIFPQNKR